MAIAMEPPPKKGSLYSEKDSGSIFIRCLTARLFPPGYEIGVRNLTILGIILVNKFYGEEWWCSILIAVTKQTRGLRACTTLG